MSTSPTYTPRSRPWDSEALLGNIPADSVILSEESRSFLREFLWYDLCAESDSEKLYRELNRRANYSAQFDAFLNAWYHDERNHARGFAYLHHLIFGDDRHEIMARALSRAADFSALAEFLDDEFKLCVLFAYDEFASVMTYEKDTFYKDLGSPVFVEWIRRVRADEALHFGNLVKLIQTVHADRLREVPETLRQVLRTENAHLEYRGTFLFDHECPHFLVSEEELNDECVNSVLRKIMRDDNARLD